MKYDEEVQQLLKEVVQHFDKEDRAVRERQIRTWKKLKFYWDGFQRIWWSEVAHDWRIFDYENAYGDSGANSSYYDKPVNVFKAYLESIIAALSVEVPGIQCTPDNPDDPLDLATAKSGDKIAELVFKHNNAQLLWLHALYIYCTEGLIAAYNYTEEKEEYGTYEEPEYKEVEKEVENLLCPVCKTNLGSRPLSDAERDEYDPGEDDVLISDFLQEGNVCPQCLTAVDPEIQKSKVIVTRFVGTTSKPKSRQKIEVYGGLFVKVPNYARKQCDCPYLILAYETHYTNIIARYPHVQKLFNQGKFQTGGMFDPYERWGRLSTQYYGEYPLNTPTVRNAWLRPSAFNVLEDEEDRKKLQKLFPDGAKVILANDEFCEAINESLDDHWTLTHNPLSDYLHHDPLGLSLVSVQEITNELISLTLQTVEHGIGQTFADPEVLNFKQYDQSEATPGIVFPAKARSGKSLSDGFFQLKTATLSGEVLPFGENIQQLGQLVSGALPSLFGGAQPNSSKTAAQYSMSRNQALQRLQNQWKMLKAWWGQIFGKVIPAYIKDMAEDESIVERDSDGNFTKILIRKAETEGKIGSVEVEGAEQLPIAWNQKKDIIMQLLQAGNPEVMAAISAPENIEFLREAIGLSDFVIPGENDRNKQNDEIRQLLNSEPMPGPDGMSFPSVQIEPEIDNNMIHAEICRNFLVGPAGQQAKIDNQAGYMNVMLHLKMHMAAIPPMPVAPPDNAAPGNEQKPKPMAAQVKPNGQ